MNLILCQSAGNSTVSGMGAKMQSYDGVFMLLIYCLTKILKCI